MLINCEQKVASDVDHVDNHGLLDLPVLAITVPSVPRHHCISVGRTVTMSEFTIGSAARNSSMSTRVERHEGQCSAACFA